MASNPVRYPSGISVFPTRQTFANWPSLPNQWQDIFVHNFMPYRSADFTLTQVNGTAASYPWTTGALALNTTNSAGTNNAYLAQGAGTVNQLQVTPGNQLWFRTKLALPQTGGSTANVYAGYFDTPTNPSTASNGIYFYKPAGGTVVHLIIKKAGTTTTIQNIADLAKPSGIYGDTTSFAGSLTFNASGTTYSSVVVNNPGSGYLIAPLIIATGAVGSGATLFAQLGSGSLFAPYITAPGSAYTAGTLAADIDPWIALSFWYNGKNMLQVGVNGRIVASITAGTSGTTLTPGATVANNSVGNTYNVAASAQLSTSIAPVQPALGDPVNMTPQVPLSAVIGLLNSTTTAQAIYVQELDIGMEYN